MASITSIVAFVILLLMTFSSSAPVGEENGNSTSEYEYTTNQNMVDWQKPANMRSMVDDQSTSVPVIREDQSSEENDVTTEYVTRSLRNYEDSSYSPATDRTVEPNYEEYTSPSSATMNEKRIYEDSSYSPATDRTVEPNYEEYTSPSSAEMNEKRTYEYSTSSPTSENSEGLNHEEHSSPASLKMNKKRNYEDSSYSPATDRTDEPNYEEYTSPSSATINEKRIYEYSTSSPTSENSEGSSETYSSPSSTQMNEKRNVMIRKNAAMMNSKRAVEDFLYTTLESSTEFNQRVIRPAESEEEIELSTTIDPKDQLDMTNDTEPLSSVHSFGKYTGLLVDQESTTPEYETTDRPDEESTKDSVVHPEQLTKTVSIIPGKITETKIYTNAPSKTSVVIQPVEQEQLNQVQNQPVAETKEWEN